MAVSVLVSTDKADYEIGEAITATVEVLGADPGSQKTVSVAAVATVDGIQIESPAVQFTVTDPPAVVVYESVESDDPAVVFTQDGADPAVWTATAA